MAAQSFKLPDDLDKRLRAEAKRADRSVSYVIVKALEATLPSERDDRQPRPPRAPIRSSSSLAKRGVKPIPKGGA